jgi:hypothetical protein
MNIAFQIYVNNHNADENYTKGKQAYKQAYSSKNLSSFPSNNFSLLEVILN